MALRAQISHATALLHDELGRPTQLIKDYMKMREMSYGALRRALILDILRRGFNFRVNCQYCIPVNKDPDLKRLIKQGKIKMVNTGGKIKNTHIKLTD